MRDAAGGSARPDAVMYCLAAMQKFKSMGAEKSKAITAEIAMLGRSGFDINNPAKKYTLKSLPGEYTGMQLVCHMYVVKQMDPSLDAGIDLSREYEAAQALFTGGR
jgi:hypothetical protein